MINLNRSRICFVSSLGLIGAGWLWQSPEAVAKKIEYKMMEFNPFYFDLEKVNKKPMGKLPTQDAWVHWSAPLFGSHPVSSNDRLHNLCARNSRPVGNPFMDRPISFCQARLEQDLQYRSEPVFRFLTMKNFTMGPKRLPYSLRYLQYANYGKATDDSQPASVAGENGILLMDLDAKLPSVPGRPEEGIFQRFRHVGGKRDGSYDVLFFVLQREAQNKPTLWSDKPTQDDIPKFAEVYVFYENGFNSKIKSISIRSYLAVNDDRLPTRDIPEFRRLVLDYNSRVYSELGAVTYYHTVQRCNGDGPFGKSSCKEVWKLFSPL